MRIRIIALFAFSLFISFGCGSGQNKPEKTSTSPALKADYVVVRPDTLTNEIRVTGTLLPSESAMVSAQTPGLIKDIYFDEGECVKAGQLLVSLDARQLEAQRQKLDAQLETAQKDVDRKRELSTIKGVSQSALDEAELIIANVEADKMELDVLIDFAAIRAPFSGQIGLRNVSKGAYLAAGSPVARLVKVDELKLEFSVPERYAAKVRPGLAITFTVAGSDTVFQGKVYAVEPAITESSRSLLVRALVDNAENRLTAGQFADIRLQFDNIPNALLVPTDAIMPRLNSEMIFAVENGLIVEREVATGVRLPRLIQIASGLSPGDTVLVTGLLQAKEGMPFEADRKVDIDNSELR